MERRLAAILAADVVGYSRMMSKDEAGTLALIQAVFGELLEPEVSEHHGRTVKLMGDGALAEFASIVDAVNCAVALQRDIRLFNAETPESERLQLRIGINLGDIIIENEDIYGDGVNLAARLQERAAPGGIALSGTAHEHAAGKVDVKFSDGGEQALKNIASPVRVYHWADGEADPKIPTTADTSLPDKPSIVVLPFTSMSGDPEQEFFADGISDDIITGLTRFSDLLVIASPSSRNVSEQSNDARAVSRSLGVAHVLEGTVRKGKDRIRIAVQLIDGSNGQILWSERFDRKLKDIFEVQDDITNIIVATLAGRIEDAEKQRIAKKPTADMAAYDHLLLGRHCLKRYSMESVSQARYHFEQCLKLDPECAGAFAGLAQTFMYENSQGHSKSLSQTLEKALLLAQKAVSLDDSDPTALYTLASIHHRRREFELARAQIQKALAANPNDYNNLCAMSWLLTCTGDLDQGIACTNDALRLNPYAPDSCLLTLCIAEYLRRQYSDAIAHFGQMKGYGVLKAIWLAASFAQAGLDEKAKNAAQEVLTLARRDFDLEPAIAPDRWQAYWSYMFPLENQEDFKHFLEGVRKAGLPF